jgi:CTP synthase (UTP-ammonia lyase)
MWRYNFYVKPTLYIYSTIISLDDLLQAANILNIHDVPNIWHVPLLLRNQNAHHSILKQLNLTNVATAPDLDSWNKMAETFDNLTNHVSIYTDTFSFTSLDFSYFCYAQVQIAMVGKYIGLTDSYLSVVKVNLESEFIDFGLLPIAFGFHHRPFFMPALHVH